MKVALLVLLVTVGLMMTLPHGGVARNHDDCFRAWTKVGCYKDEKGPNNSRRALKEILITDRDPSMKSYSGLPIDWQNWAPYLHELACRCAEAARAKGYKMFGLQFYGECWAGEQDEERYDMYGESDKCFENFEKKGCDKAADEECMGNQNENYVYRLEEDPFA